MPLGLFSAAAYEVRTSLLLRRRPPDLHRRTYRFDLEHNAEDRLREALAPNSPQTIAMMKSLIDSALTRNNVTILLLKRVKKTRCRSATYAAAARITA
jgi:hypothetical protein